MSPLLAFWGILACIFYINMFGKGQQINCFQALLMHFTHPFHSFWRRDVLYLSKVSKVANEGLTCNLSYTTLSILKVTLLKKRTHANSTTHQSNVLR
jgi:hypothetical protein